MNTKTHFKNSIDPTMEKRAARRAKVAANLAAEEQADEVKRYLASQLAELKQKVTEQNSQHEGFEQKLTAHSSLDNVAIAGALLRARHSEDIRQILSDVVGAEWLREHLGSIVEAAKALTVAPAEKALKDFETQNPEIAKNFKLIQMPEAPMTTPPNVDEFAQPTPPLPLATRMAFTSLTAPVVAEVSNNNPMFACNAED